MNDSSQRQAVGRIVGLDGLRAISILLVLVGHGSSTAPSLGALEPLAPYLENASLGVQTFFVISGFLITHLLRKEWEKTGTIGLGAFYVRRVLRIFPAFYTYLFVLILVQVLGWIDTSCGDFASAGLFLTNYKHWLPWPTNDDYWYVGHFWTLSLEEQFYLFWPVTILAVGMARAQNAALLIVFAAPLARVITYFVWPDSRAQLGMMLHTAADPIMAGCLAALWQGRACLETILVRSSSWPWPLAGALFLLIGSPWLSTHFRGMYSMTIGLSLNSVTIAFIMLWVIRHPTSLAVRLLSTPMVRHIGILSYSLYLWQQPFLTPKNQTWTGVFPINFLMCFAAAAVCFWVVERPFLRLRDHFCGNRRSTAIPSAGSPVLVKDAL